MRCVLMLLLVVGMSSGSTVAYYNQAQWQASVDAQNPASVTNISFATEDWTSSFQASRSLDSLTSESATAAGDGLAISIVAGYSPLGVANNSLLGHAGNGVFSDTISKYGSTTFNFSDPIDAFGGDFELTGSNGLALFLGNGTQLTTPDGLYNSFIGVVSDQPFSSITLTWGQNGSCVECFGNSYVLSNFEVAESPVATPEPSFQYPIAGLLLFVICLTVLRRQ